MAKKYRHDALGEFRSGLEAIAALGSAGALEVGAGLAGLGTLATGGGLNKAVSRIEDISNMGYQPRDPRVLEGMGTALAPVGKAVMNLKDIAGDRTLAATGSPGLASIASISPEIVGTMLGLKGMPKGLGRPGQTGPGFNVPDAGPDMSRRKFIKDAGMVAAAAPLMGKGLLDIPEGAPVKAAVKAAAPALKVAPTSKVGWARSYFEVFPQLKAAFKKGGMKEVHEVIDQKNKYPEFDADGEAVDVPSKMFIDPSEEKVLRESIDNPFEVEGEYSGLPPELLKEYFEDSIRDVHMYNGEIDFTKGRGHAFLQEDDFELDNWVIERISKGDLPPEVVEKIQNLGYMDD